MIISPLKQENKFPVFKFNFGSDLMNLKFLIVLTMVLCVFCVLPVNAYDVNITNNPQSYHDVYFTLPNNTLYFGFSYAVPYLQGSVWQFYEVDTSLNNGGYLYSPQSQQLGRFYGTGFVPDMGIGTHNTDSPLIQFSETDYVTFHVTYSIDSNYNPAPDCYITSSVISQTADTITYRVSCVPDNGYTYFTEITETEQTIMNVPNLNAVDTVKDITVGLNGTLIYSVAVQNIGDISGQRKVINLYLDGINDIPIEPTPQPTDTPIYPDRIQAYIQTYDYQTGNLLTGVNLSVYEVIDNNGNLQIGNNIYSSINAESQTILTVKNNTEYFVKNEKVGYFSVKNAVYDSLNGETGYLWNPSLMNPLRLYYSRLDASAQYNANFIVQDVNNNGLSGVSVTMDNAVTKVSNSIGGLTFNNISAGTHTFVFVKNGYQTAQQTIDIQLQYAAFYQTMYKDNQIIQPTTQPTAYPTVQPTVQPTITPIDQPSNLAESVKYGLAKMFGVNSLNTINLIFALMIILFPAVVAGVITNQALGFIAGGLIGFVFALGIGLIPIWVFFSMIMLSVIYLVMTHTESGF